MSLSVSLKTEHLQQKEIIIPEDGASKLKERGISPDKILKQICFEVDRAKLPLSERYTFKFLGDEKQEFVFLQFRLKEEQARLCKFTIRDEQGLNDEYGLKHPSMTQSLIKKLHDVSFVDPIPSFVVIAGLVEFNDITVNLSDEMQKNMKGKRGDDHTLSLEVLKKFLALEKKWLLATEENSSDTNEKGVFYFRLQQSDDEESIIRVVLLRDFMGYTTVLTSFRPAMSNIKHELRLDTDTRFNTWKSSLPIITDSQ